MKWQSAIPHSAVLVLALCGVTLLAQPAGTGTTSVVTGAVLAASCSQSHVSTALSAVSAGGTVLIPAGTCNWASGITWAAPANVTVRGAGSLTTTGGGDATVIVDNYNSSNELLDITATTALRITGLTIRGGSGILKPNGIVYIHGTAALRVDHVTVDTTTYSPAINVPTLWFGDGLTGVLDHSILEVQGVSALYFFMGMGTNGQADESWAAATDFGGSGYFFVEDNIFRGAEPTRVGDCYNGSRVVVRFNSMEGTGGLEAHATGHAGDGRGCRSIESYGNNYTASVGDPSRVFADAGSGTSLVWGNTVASQTLRSGILFDVVRKDNTVYAQTATPGGWGYCGTAFNGTGSNWDGNTSASTGYPCIDQPGRGQSDLLTGSFSTKTNSTTGTIAWPNQALEPIYVWQNTFTPHSGYGGSFYVANERVVANRDYYPQASGIQTTSSAPFDGTVGTGWGTAARRPSTCTAGVAYFATDEGTWNTSSTNPEGVNVAGADGRLYKCTATNTWTLYYTPYTYPHPLNRGSF